MTSFLHIDEAIDPCPEIAFAHKYAREALFGCSSLRVPRDIVSHVRYAVVASPLGDLVISGNADDTVTGLAFAHSGTTPMAYQRDDGAFPETVKQLRAYFAGELRRFELKLRPGGTPFQARVWAALQEIPYGQTTSYAALAATLGVPRAVRAVGHANGRNPISIVIPCHRLIGADGGLTGYGGGLERKRWLLAHEGAASALRQ